MTDRGVVARAIAVGVAALLLGVLVVRNAFVEAYGVENPTKAAAIWPAHPTVILASGLAEVGASAAAARPINPATVRRMLETGAKAPLAPEPYLVRGVEAQAAGSGALALRAFLEARHRDPRSVAARFFLADHYLKAGATHQGLAEISALTRLVPQSLKGVAPQLAAFARMPGSGTEVRTLLRDQPQLQPWLLNELAANPADAGLALSLWSGQATDQDRQWQQRLVNSLVAAGQYGQAYQAWRRFDPQVIPAGELVDPRFDGNRMAPFGWTFASGAAGVAEPEGGGRLHILYYGRDDLSLASQLLMLKPGDYRLAMRISDAQPSAKALSWTVRCLSPVREIAAVDFSSTKNGLLALDFTVPSQGCPALQLDLIGTAPELPEQAELSIGQLSLSRRGQ